MNEIERRVLELLLAGNNDTLEVLRKQLSAASVVDREYTGAGFFTHLAVPTNVPRLRNRGRVVVGDVYAKIAGLAHEAGFLLFVNDGAIDCLECFIVDESWPKNAVMERAYYVRPSTPGSSNLIESNERNLEWALRDAF